LIIQILGGFFVWFSKGMITYNPQYMLSPMPCHYNSIASVETVHFSALTRILCVHE